MTDDPLATVRERARPTSSGAISASRWWTPSRAGCACACPSATRSAMPPALPCTAACTARSWTPRWAARCDAPRGRGRRRGADDARPERELSLQRERGRRLRGRAHPAARADHRLRRGDDHRSPGQGGGRRPGNVHDPRRVGQGVASLFRASGRGVPAARRACRQCGGGRGGRSPRDTLTRNRLRHSQRATRSCWEASATRRRYGPGESAPAPAPHRRVSTFLARPGARRRSSRPAHLVLGSDVAINLRAWWNCCCFPRRGRCHSGAGSEGAARPPPNLLPVRRLPTVRCHEAEGAAEPPTS